MKNFYIFCSVVVLATASHAAGDDDGDMGLRDLFQEPEVQKTEKKEEAAPVENKDLSQKAQRLANKIKQYKRTLDKIKNLLNENQEKQSDIRKERMALKEEEMKALQTRRENLSKGQQALNKKIEVMESSLVTMKVLESGSSSSS